MLAGLQRFKRNGRVLRIRSAHVDGVDRWIFENAAIVCFDSLDAISCRKTLCRVEASSGYCHGVHGSHSADCFEMDASHESSTNDCSA